MAMDSREPEVTNVKKLFVTLNQELVAELKWKGSPTDDEGYESALRELSGRIDAHMQKKSVEINYVKINNAGSSHEDILSEYKKAGDQVPATLETLVAVKCFLNAKVHCSTYSKPKVEEAGDKLPVEEQIGCTVETRPLLGAAPPHAVDAFYNSIRDNESHYKFRGSY